MNLVIIGDISFYLVGLVVLGVIYWDIMIEIRYKRVGTIRG